MRQRVLRCSLLVCVLLLAGQLFAQIELTLKKDFINKFADRVTIDTNFTVDKTSKIHPAKDDGDIHIAGRAPEIGLPAVAEIMNAKSERNSAVKDVLNAVGAGPISISGAWRIWSEHGGQTEDIMGDPVEPMTSSGAPHLFEIHPVTRVGSKAVPNTWSPIPGFAYKDADQAFTVYERTRSHITENSNGSVTISTEKAGYNYTEFVAELISPPFALQDGTAVYARILDLNGDLQVTKRRLVFAKGTPPEDAVKALTTGAKLQVVGIPRVSLKLVKWRLEHHTGKFANALDWNLPYEMIVAAVTEANSDAIPTGGDN